MKKYLVYLYIIVTTGAVYACNNDEPIDTANSIFTDTEQDVTGFDTWLLNNFVRPYNVQVKYRLDDTETDVQYDLVPADYDKAVALMKVVKHVWMSAYDEIWGVDQTRIYVPKLIHLIGNVAYTQSGEILGQAEGGLKVTLLRVNELDFSKIDPAMLNEYYFKTMHHEFTHILNQKKPYDPAFERISEGKYVGSDWYQQTTNKALGQGFISPYAMDRATEDFAEMVSMYVTNTAAQWEAWLRMAGGTGRPIIEKKFKIVYDYMNDSWGINLDELRTIVQRRQNEIPLLDLSTL
ncbi:MAG: putative zinc-binding metallopeptidase [Mediterranea sp.]|nr:putative zinc-binding metallopeptidase [Mediterranea sp.]